MSHPDPCYDPDNSYEDDMNYDDHNDFYDDADQKMERNWDDVGADDLEDDDDSWDNPFEDNMDGDHDSAMTSCGWGTDEDYGHFGDDIDAFHDYYGEDY